MSGARPASPSNVSNTFRTTEPAPANDRVVVATSQLAFLLATCPSDALRDGREALTLASELAARAKPDDVATLDVLAAALAENGRFDEALATIRRALTVAAAQKNTQLEQALRAREAAYAAKRAFRTGR